MGQAIVNPDDVRPAFATQLRQFSNDILGNEGIDGPSRPAQAGLQFDLA